MLLRQLRACITTKSASFLEELLVMIVMKRLNIGSERGTTSDWQTPVPKMAIKTR